MLVTVQREVVRYVENIVLEQVTDGKQLVTQRHVVERVAGGVVFQYLDHGEILFSGNAALRVGDLGVPDVELVRQVVGEDRVQFGNVARDAAVVGVVVVAEVDVLDTGTIGGPEAGRNVANGVPVGGHVGEGRVVVETGRQLMTVADVVVQTHVNAFLLRSEGIAIRSARVVSVELLNAVAYEVGAGKGNPADDEAVGGFAVPGGPLQEAGYGFRLAFVGAEEEQLILDDRPPEGCPVDLVLAVTRIDGDIARTGTLGLVVAQEVVSRPAEVIGTGLGYRVDRRTGESRIAHVVGSQVYANGLDRVDADRATAGELTASQAEVVVVDVAVNRVVVEAAAGTGKAGPVALGGEAGVIVQATADGGQPLDFLAGDIDR